jgi:ABC-type Fe3+/spermidine/putrescine transport system ATPase subunit
MLEVADVAVVADGRRIIEDVTFSVGDSEVVALLGPSGSGKTTVLRAIAGLVAIDQGELRWDGQSIVGTPTHERDFGLMFQSYALFPHLDVAGNVGFGLEMRRAPDIHDRVTETLEWVGLSGFGSRDVASLSGGERQRVALARSLAPRPRLLMLDEPLAALDRELRTRLAVEIRGLLTDKGITSIVVTHDREEANALADHVVLMRGGRVVQRGTFSELEASPVDDWARSFLGE